MRDYSCAYWYCSRRGIVLRPFGIGHMWVCETHAMVRP